MRIGAGKRLPVFPHYPTATTATVGQAFGLVDGGQVGSTDGAVWGSLVMPQRGLRQRDFRDKPGGVSWPGSMTITIEGIGTMSKLIKNQE